ncbi:MarR family transcriptional regulator [Kribbella amoyensis]|uniref:MarR family transcriptional regulator n=1 Tax=Kribbella amoyensis TaxID=996641 RepID=A0A561BUJ3_9ACTN|nr:MarR family transcriptional regulator [Kribbella amoyensis]TWD82452.1 MarR family transcriptional regulator [Kribbella amoyensis]
MLNRLFAVSILMADDMARGLAARGLTRARATALWEIARHGPLNQRQLADRLQVTPRNVTTLVDALEQSGFVVRTAHADDRRALLVKPTRKGSAAARRMDAESDRLAEDLFGDLPAADVATVDRVLAQLEQRLSTS